MCRTTVRLANGDPNKIKSLTHLIVKTPKVTETKEGVRDGHKIG